MNTFVSVKSTTQAPPCVYMLNENSYMVGVGHIFVSQDNRVVWHFIDDENIEDPSNKYNGDMPVFENLRDAIAEAIK